MSASKRKPIACQRCHKRKVKCLGGVPCQNCVSAGLSCTFPVRDRNIVVSETYIRRLQAQSHIHSETPSYVNVQATGDISSRTSEVGLQASIPPTEGSRKDRVATLTLKHATSEAFVSGLKRLSARDSPVSPGPNYNVNQAPAGSYLEGPDEVSNYDYVSLNFDTSSLKVAIQLPPYPYAVQLVQQFETMMAYEYHWYLRREFHSALERTYRSPDSEQSRNRTWLSKLLAVFALGESFNSYEPPLIDLTQDVHMTRREEDAKASYLPGANFFEQALSLFKMPSEEPEIGHVEALNLISFFCYSLNRRKTAYMYAGISMRIACTLMLHKPVPPKPPAVAEHRKRIWWTTFLMDAMTSSEMGLRATFALIQAEQPLPLDEQLAPADRDDFWGSKTMTAHLNLCNIRTLILETLAQLQESDFASYEKATEVPLRELELWKLQLPADSSFEFSQGIPQAMLDQPWMRSLASVYLRYHQSYILLIRPVFFKLLGIVLRKDTVTSSLDGLISLCSQCLEAAKCNMRILTTLSSRDRIAKYGFYDSLHLFSGIMIFSLSRLVNTVRPLSLMQDPQDLSLYSVAKDLLMTMASCGNLASKGHVQMLEDIEQLLDVVSQNQETQTPTFGSEIFPWIDSIDNSGYFLDTTEYS